MRGGVAKIQQAHSLVVAKMKDLAKQYKAGDTSVIPQLKDLTTTKKELELALDRAVSNTNRNQDLEQGINEIGMFNDPVGYEKSKPAKPTYTKKYVSKGVYDIFKHGKKVKTVKDGEGAANAWMNNARRGQKNEEVGGQSISDLKPGDKFEFNGKTFTLIKHIEGNTATVILPNGDTSRVSFGGKINTGKKAGIGPHSFGQGKGHHIDEDDSKDPNDKYVVRPCKNKKEPWAVWEGETRVKGFAEKKDAQAYADKQNKEQGLNEEKSTCCGKCGRKHVKGTKCKTPYLKGKDHCRTR